MSKPFYVSLRTKQHLGYLVACGTNEIFSVRALNFVVQSASTSPTVLNPRIYDFVSGFRAALLAVSEAEIFSLGERLAAQYTDVDGGLDTQAQALDRLSVQRYDLSRPWEDAAKARHVTKASPT